jgi:phage host-nuclease inhibitor protein Gam
MSKFHRIGHIEGYLDNLDKKMQRFESKIDEKQKKSEKKLVTNFEGLKSDIASLKKEVTALKVDEIPSLKKLIEEEEDSKGLAELVQKQQTQLEALKNEVASLQTLVKSLIKMQQASGEVKSRGRLAPRKSP